MLCCSMAYRVTSAMAVQHVQNVQQHQHRIHRVTGKSTESVLKKETRNLRPSTYLCSLPVEPLMQHEQQCHS